MFTHYEIFPRTLRFRFRAGTSRGVYTLRRVWYVVLGDDNGRLGVGECAPLHDLSCDASDDYEAALHSACQAFMQTGQCDAFVDKPSIRFGLETARLHLERGNVALFDSDFVHADAPLLINGLIWMGTFDEMAARLEEKMKAGFRCIKIKIGAIDFEREVALIKSIRSLFAARDVQIRLDANGAFAPNDALRKLQRLSALDIHSIEQPIRAGQWQQMAEICRQTPIPVALDEELIGVHSSDEKRRLLDTIKPQFIILKPTLHGGFAGCDEWIDEARSRQIAFWATSALESNVGLNAIAQWAATKQVTMPQGLGTGQLFEENIPMPLTIEGERLRFNKRQMPDAQQIIDAIKRLPQ